MKLFGNKQKDSAGSGGQRKSAAAGGGPKKSGAPAAAKGRAALIAVLAVAAALLAGAAAGVSLVSRVNTIFPNVTVDGLDIGGLTLTETAEKLSASGYGDLAGKSVSVVLPTEYTLTVSAGDVCTETPVSDIALMAWDACKGGSAVSDALTYLRCTLGGMELESGSALTVDTAAVQAAVENAAGEVRRALLGSDLSIGEDSISVVKGAQSVEIDTAEVAALITEAFREENYTTLSYDAEILPNTELDLQGLYDTVARKASDAYYDRDAAEIVPETVGVSFDMAQARSLWDGASYGDTVYIPLVLTEPEVTAAGLDALLFRDRLSTVSTSLTTSSGNRINNVARAAESVDGTVVMPGETFSYNDALGERTKENGYLMAGAYAGGETVQEYGGGICQVSSMVYYCALYANLKITARTCHMFPVSYLPPGLDATVSWGGPEFKFVNDREYPVRISAWMDDDNRKVNLEFWGTDVDGSYVEMTSDTWFMTDGVWDVRIGYKAQTYRSVFDSDGNLLSRRTEAVSTYNYHPEDIDWPPEALETDDPENPEETEYPEATEVIEEPEVPPVTEAPEGPEVTDTPAPGGDPEETETPPEAEEPPEPETPPAEEAPGETESPPATETPEEPDAPGREEDGVLPTQPVGE